MAAAVDSRNPYFRGLRGKRGLSPRLSRRTSCSATARTPRHRRSDGLHDRRLPHQQGGDRQLREVREGDRDGDDAGPGVSGPPQRGSSGDRGEYVSMSRSTAGNSSPVMCRASRFCALRAPRETRRCHSVQTSRPHSTAAGCNERFLAPGQPRLSELREPTCCAEDHSHHPHAPVEERGEVGDQRSADADGALRSRIRVLDLARAGRSTPLPVRESLLAAAGWDGSSWPGT